MRLRKRKLLSKEAKKDRMVYNLVILGTLVLLFGYSIAFCAVSTSLKFEGSGKVEVRGGPYYYKNGYFYTDLAQANAESDSYKIKYNGSYVTSLSTMVDIMEKDSSGNYIIYMMTPYNVASGGETVTVGKTVRIYLDKFDNSDAVFKVSNPLNINASSGKLYIGYALPKVLSKSLFYNTSTLTLTNVTISDITASSSTLITTSAGTLNLTNTEITGVSNNNAIMYFDGTPKSKFTLNNVNIHDNIMRTNNNYVISSLANCSEKKITGSSIIYDNKYEDSYQQQNLGIYMSSNDSNITVDGTGLTSGSKIGVRFYSGSKVIPSTSNPITIFKNITRSAITPGTNIISDDGYTVAYGDSNSTTTIVAK